MRSRRASHVRFPARERVGLWGKWARRGCGGNGFVGEDEFGGVGLLGFLPLQSGECCGTEKHGDFGKGDEDANGEADD